MARFLLKRLGLAVITLFLLSVLVFIGAQMLPGNVARRILGPFADQAAVDNLNHQLGTDRPILTQYWDWLTGLVRGNFVRAPLPKADAVVASLALHHVRTRTAKLRLFRRVRAGEKPGYPRFRGRDRYDSVTYSQAGWKLKDGRLDLTGIGAIKVRWSRPIQGTIKAVTIRRSADQWYVCFSCVLDVPQPVPPDRPATAAR